jgi:hypothetical protein
MAGLKFRIERKEILYALLGVLFIIGWVVFLQPIIAPYLQAIPPILAMLIYQSGFFVGALFVANILDSKKVQFKASIILFIVLLGLDLIYPPFLLSQGGVINMSVDQWYVASDAGIASLYQMFVPQILIHIPFTDTAIALVWLLTYILTPILLILVIPIIIGDPKTIARAFA